MSVALSKVRNRVRERIRDIDSHSPPIAGVSVDMAIAEAYLLLSSQLPKPEIYTASAFTIMGGGDTFSLPVTVTGSGYGTGTTEYAGNVRIQLVSNGLFLFRRSQSEMDAVRNWRPVSQIILGVPDSYHLYEDSGQVVRGRCFPGASADEACNLYATIERDDLRDYVGTGGAEGLDTATIMFSRQAADALVRYTAADLIDRMLPEDLTRRRLNPNVSNTWRKEADDQLVRDAARLHNLKSVGRVQRFMP